MSEILLDFGTKYVKIWKLSNESSVTNFTLLGSVPSQLWASENGNYFIGEYDEIKTGGALHEGFNCSLDVLFRLMYFPQEAKLYIRNVTLGENISSIVKSPQLFSRYQEIIKVFLNELINYIFTTTEIDAIEKVLCFRSKPLYDKEFSQIVTTLFPVTFVNRAEILARIYGVEQIKIEEVFIIIDLGESHCDFIIARKTSDESIVEISAEYCEVGGQYIDTLIYNCIISELKSKNSNGTPELQMKECELAKKKIKIAAAYVNYRYKFKKGPQRYLLHTHVLESLSKPYVNRVISFVKKNVRDLDLDEIKNVFLIGGSSKVSGIESEFKKIFGSKLNVEHRKYYERGISQIN